MVADELCGGSGKLGNHEKESAENRDETRPFLARRQTHLVDEEHLVVNLYAEIVCLDDQVVLVALAVAGKIRIRMLAVVIDFLSSGCATFGSADTHTR